MPAALPSHDSVSRCCQMSPGTGGRRVCGISPGGENHWATLSFGDFSGLSPRSVGLIHSANFVFSLPSSSHCVRTRLGSGGPKVIRTLKHSQGVLG